jgi:hypothetical protein
MEMPQVNWKVDLGHILTILTMVGALLIAWGQFSGRFAVIEATQAEMGKDITYMMGQHGALAEKLEGVRRDQAAMATHLNDMDERMHELYGQQEKKR